MSRSQKVAALSLSTVWRWQPLKKWFLRCTTGLSWSAPWAASSPGPPTGSECGRWTTAGYVRCPGPSAAGVLSGGSGGHGQKKNHVINAWKELERKSCSFRPGSLLKGDLGCWYYFTGCNQLLPNVQNPCWKSQLLAGRILFILIQLRFLLFVLNLKCVKTRTAVSPRWYVLGETHVPGDFFCFNFK